MGQEEKKIGSIIYELLHQDKIRSKYAESRLPEIWSEMMSPLIVSYTKKIELSGTTVKIYVKSAPLRQELIMGKDQIKTFFNDKLPHVSIQNVLIF